MIKNTEPAGGATSSIKTSVFYLAPLLGMSRQVVINSLGLEFANQGASAFHLFSTGQCGLPVGSDIKNKQAAERNT